MVDPQIDVHVAAHVDAEVAQLGIARYKLVLCDHKTRIYEVAARNLCVASRNTFDPDKVAWRKIRKLASGCPSPSIWWRCLQWNDNEDFQLGCLALSHFALCGQAYSRERERSA